MKPALLFVPLLAALSLPLLAAPASDPFRTFTLTIDNHQKQVMVKDGDGARLFSGLLASPNLTVRLKPQTAERNLLTLEDETKKVLWSRPLAARSAKWSLNSAQGGQGLLFTSEAVPEISSKNTDDTFVEAVFTLGQDDEYQSFTIQTTEHKAVGVPSKDGTRMVVDGKQANFQLSQSGTDGSVAVAGKQYPYHQVQRGGKTYRDMDLGGQHVLMPADSTFHFNIPDLGGPGELVIDAPAKP